MSDNLRFAPILDEAINPIERLRGRGGVGRTARAADTPLETLASRSESAPPAPSAPTAAPGRVATDESDATGAGGAPFEEPVLVRARSGGVHRAVPARRVPRRATAAVLVLVVACMAIVITLVAF